MGIPEKRTKIPREGPKEDPFTEDPKEDHAIEDYIKNYCNRILATKEFIPFVITFFYQLILGKVYIWNTCFFGSLCYKSVICNVIFQV